MSVCGIMLMNMSLAISIFSLKVSWLKLLFLILLKSRSSSLWKACCGYSRPLLFLVYLLFNFLVTLTVSPPAPLHDTPLPSSSYAALLA